MLYGFLAVLALGILIIVHEWGHYIVAKLCNMRVDRFAIGFGPAIVQRRRGETTFQIGAVPLGGYVQIAGLNPEDENIDPSDPRSYPNRPAWQRFLTIAAGPVVNYLFASLLSFLAADAVKLRQFAQTAFDQIGFAGQQQCFAPGNDVFLSHKKRSRCRLGNNIASGEVSKPINVPRTCARCRGIVFTTPGSCNNQRRGNVRSSQYNIRAA